MRILGLITARGGSKRIEGKNLRNLGGRPLICWTIDLAKQISALCDILVSTDNPDIAKIAVGAGAEVPWFRPPELATDTASSVDVCLHALSWYEQNKGEVDGLLLLQPTSPFRSAETVLRGIELFSARDRRPVVAVSPAESHPAWCFRIEGGSLRSFLKIEGASLRSQDLPPAYRINGAFYLISPKRLREGKSFLGDDVVPLLVNDQVEAIDIDTEWDWSVAEMALKRGGGH